MELKVVDKLPPRVSPGRMHSDTSAIIAKMARTRKPVLSVRLPTIGDAKDRANSLKQLRRRDRIIFKKLIQDKNMLWIQIR